jgi:hypothetical protein
MNPEIVRAIKMGAMDALRFYLALLTAPYHIAKAFVTRPIDEPFHWTWENRVLPRSRQKADESGSAGVAAS